MEPVNHKGSILKPAVVGGLIFGVGLFVIQLLANYYVIGKEPTGNVFLFSLVSIPTCLAGLFISFLAVKLYIKEYGSEMTIGTGSLLGLSAGAVAGVVSVILGLVWPVIDGSYIENLYGSMIAEAELSSDLPGEMKQIMIDGFYEEIQNFYSVTNIVTNLLVSVLMLGVLNAITGLIAAKIMGTKPVESL